MGHGPQEKGICVLQGPARPVHPINPNESSSYRVAFPSSGAGSSPAHRPTSNTRSQQEPAACTEQLCCDRFLLASWLGSVDAWLPLPGCEPQASPLLLEKTPFNLVCAQKRTESQAFSHDLTQVLPEVCIPKWDGISKQMWPRPKVF